MIKEVFLEEEKERIIEFLSSFDLKLDDDIIKTFYIEENERIIGTVSVSGYIIKDLAVSKDSQGENIASQLISHVINYFASNLIYTYQVFTKTEYKNLFLSLNFHLLVETDRLVMLEGGVHNIDNALDDIRRQLNVRFAPINENSDIGCVVINGNPLTIGHEYLVSRVTKKHSMVIVFIVEEDKSLFTFKERLGMAYLTFHKYDNVLVIPSSKYIVSSLTFPTYFLKSDEVNEEMAMIDGLIFRDYFMKKLFIKKRYFGSEINCKMSSYNEILKSILGNKMEIISRLEINKEIVSASTVRLLLKKNKVEEALKFIPNECHFIIRNKKLEL